jgi:hypothetical protein
VHLLQLYVTLRHFPAQQMGSSIAQNRLHRNPCCSKLRQYKINNEVAHLCETQLSLAITIVFLMFFPVNLVHFPFERVQNLHSSIHVPYLFLPAHSLKLKYYGSPLKGPLG